MIIETLVIPVERKSLRGRKNRRMISYQCDQCGCKYVGKYQKQYLNDRKFHVCSRVCLANSRKISGVACQYQLSRRNMTLWHTNMSSTVKNRYGVENVSSLDWVKKKKVETTQLHYGVDNPQQHPEIKRRTLETHASHGRNWMSAPEKKFRIVLEQHYGIENVKVQQLIKGKWSIDFYVKTIDTYVQFDGVYWHGLDRPLELIKSSQFKRDKAIMGKWLKDRELDEYAKNNSMRLVRITDKMFYNDAQLCIKMIEEKNV